MQAINSCRPVVDLIFILDLCIICISVLIVSVRVGSIICRAVPNHHDFRMPRKSCEVSIGIGYLFYIIIICDSGTVVSVLILN